MKRLGHDCRGAQVWLCGEVSMKSGGGVMFRCYGVGLCGMRSMSIIGGTYIEVPRLKGEKTGDVAGMVGVRLRWWGLGAVNGGVG